ncbi:MAG: hypothetical protein J2P23_04710 [Microlunatus sp.]|nr:hypothetical protein [Microlunatus sp.]
MSTQTILAIILGLGLLIFISVRQMRWQRPGRQQKLPMILALVGVIEAATSWNNALLSRVSAVDLLLVGVELAVAVLGGWLMGRLTEIGTVGGVTQARLRPAGLAVWLGFILLRVGMAVAGGFLGAVLTSNPAVILFAVAIVKGTQVLIVRERISRHELAAERRMDSVIGS